MNSPVNRLSTALEGRYRVERELGQGGMATVYLAHDVRHDRKVALKVLRPELAAVIGADRFLHEIKTTANLQHPHILGLIDSGESDGLLWYVMPYMEGESLRDRLNREKQLPIDDAVRLTREVASALDYAHRHKVIHRDIKPENILLHDGSALVADFGIALAVTSAGATRMTETGMSLGTPAYMSPEQAMGERELDARADVYALGCVAYEMLVGLPPFTGATAQQIVAKVITEKPPLASVSRDTVPSHVAAAVRKALSKLPADRFGTAAEFSQALGDATFTVTRAGEDSGPATGAGASARARAPVQVWAPWAAAAALAAVAAWGWLRPQPAAPVTRFAIALEELSTPSAQDPPAFAPDGRRFVYAGDTGLMLRELDEPVAVRVPGTGNAWGASFSTDGKSIAYGEGFPGPLKRLPLSGGQATTLVRDSAQGYGVAWGDDGWVYFIGGIPGALMRVREEGGAPEVILRPDSSHDELMFIFPDLLPGGRAALVTVVRRNGAWDIGAVDIGAHRLTILTRGVRGLYAASGHLISVEGDGKIMATPFDAGRLALAGRSVQVADGVRIDNGAAFVGLSRSGTLLYGRFRPVRQVVRVSAAGQQTPIDPAWQGELETLAMSPDQTRIAVTEKRDGASEIWVRDLRSGSYTRLARGGIFNYRPAWTPDGASVVFTSDRNGRLALYSARADGSTPPRKVLDVARAVDENTWSRDGQWLIYRMGSGGGRDIYGIRLGKDSVPGVPLAASDYDEFAPALSPDSHWLAYASLESGQAEVYVRPFPNVDAGKWLVSRRGGTEPAWASSSRTLFYRSADSLVSVEVQSGSAFHAGSRRALFLEESYPDSRHTAYAVTSDGGFLFSRELPSPPTRFVLVTNWFEELKRKVPR